MTLKVGIDIHGVIDTHPDKFRKLSQALVAAGAEVHIVTGTRKDARMEKLLTEHDIAYTHYFSIVDHLMNAGESVEWINGDPFADENAWNQAKSEYCDAQNIDFMIDDSEVYRKTFAKTSTTFLQLF